MECRAVPSRRYGARPVGRECAAGPRSLLRRPAVASYQFEKVRTEVRLAALPNNPLDRPEPGEPGIRLPNQAASIVEGPGEQLVALIERESKDGGASDLDYFQELLAIQQNGPKNIGFFGTRNMGFLHQQLVEILSYAMVLTGNHIYTSGATGTNAAVIRGALRAEKPDLLTVVLPQSLSKQPQESQELLEKVEKIIEMPQNDSLQLLEASRICNTEIISHVQQIICFAFHDSNVLLETCREAKDKKTMVTLFYLD